MATVNRVKGSIPVRSNFSYPEIISLNALLACNAMS